MGLVKNLLLIQLRLISVSVQLGVGNQVTNPENVNGVTILLEFEGYIDRIMSEVPDSFLLGGPVWRVRRTYPVPGITDILVVSQSHRRVYWIWLIPMCWLLVTLGKK